MPIELANLLIFVILAGAFLFVTLALGKRLRPSAPGGDTTAATGAGSSP